jgi:hypothetical protein
MRWGAVEGTESCKGDRGPYRGQRAIEGTEGHRGVEGCKGDIGP